MTDYEFDVVPVLENITGETVELLRGSPRGTIIRCPFHDDRKPSAWISKDRRGFKCMSCSRQGDAISLLRLEEGLDFKAAVSRAQTILGVDGGDSTSAGSPVGRSGPVFELPWNT